LFAGIAWVLVQYGIPLLMSLYLFNFKEGTSFITNEPLHHRHIVQHA